jgi:hypothetical protein
MATSPNYAWAEPDNSSLVKNGAADIRTLGDAIDTSVWNIGYGQAGKNKVINSDFDVWQRGTSFTNPANLTYTADRIGIYFDGSGATRTVSQQANVGAIGVYSPTYFIRFAHSVAGTGASNNLWYTRLEDVSTYAGQTVTFSIYAKAAATTVLPQISVDQNFGSGGSASVTTVFATSVSVTTSWVRYSYSVAIPSITGKTVGANNYLGIEVRMPLNATFTLDFSQIQLEAGSKATPFQTASGGSPQAELAMCQRYYWRSTASAAYSRLTNSGYGQSATAITVPLVNPVEMRTQATTLDYGGTVGAYDGTNITTCTAVTLDSSSSPKISVIAGTVASGLTQYRPYGFIANNSSTAYIGLSAEL